MGIDDQVLATLDRLLHHSSTINIKGESFRLKEKRRAGLLSQQAPGNTAAPARDSGNRPGQALRSFRVQPAIVSLAINKEFVK